MSEKGYPVYKIDAPGKVKLLHLLRETGEVYGPVTGEDEVCRLELWADGRFPELAILPRLPLKKLLFPSGEKLWFWDGEAFASPAPAAPLIVVGLPLCELQAAWYLDQVFGDDDIYQKRRANILLVGGKCEPGPLCRCDATLPVVGDLLLGSDRVWCLSAAGEKLVAGLGVAAVPREQPLPVIVTSESRAALSETAFSASVGARLWDEESRRCLSCGACSAVCPTCYCFDTLDASGLDRSATRCLVWDNCFFAEHGQVAGGQDFRPGRAARLRFRLEHKRLGFGPLRGLDACVGCGRCQQACPVDIDLDQVVARLTAEAAP